ncbi:putative Rossmann-fold nucleotide-binding protein [Bradyrhizobium sp. i1.4.4]|uniref:SLOG cluster 4 domain-containing protein n=1 Tax=Bradyrhizobium sp. LA6.10 TaxID=3156318 RepID=UPI003396BC24
MSVTMPNQLYTAEDLLGGFNPWDKMGYTLSRDFAIYREFVANGGPLPASLAVRAEQAAHDAAIADALRIFLKTVQRPLVGIMGGHSLPRNHPAYKAIAHLARDLARKDFLLVTGGGPGVMEAAHLGVAFSSTETTKELDDAIEALGKAPKAPVLDDLFAPDWTIKEGKLKALLEARDWLRAAIEVRRKAPATLPVSLAIPTWLYGAEPTMPFATHYAKYFQNSLREEALVNNSRAGIVYGRGGGGTMREVYQDVERNYYAKTLDEVTPMIFFDVEKYWETDPVMEEMKATTPGINVKPTIRPILTFGLVSEKRHKKDVEACLDKKLLFTTDHAVIIDALREHEEQSQKNLTFALAAEPLKIGTLRMNRR